MKTSGVFTLHRYTITVPAVGSPMLLVFFGDVHRDSPHHAKEDWQRFLDYARKLKNAWFIGLGDYLDSMSTSERECLRNAHFHESTTIDLAELANAKVSLLAKELAFMKGRLIGLMGGNHFFRFDSGITSDQKLCDKLDCKYLGVSTFTRLTFDYRSNRLPFDIWAHHGKGAGRLPGSSINRIDQMREHADADCYVMGDDHFRAAVPANPRLRLHKDIRGSSGVKLDSHQQWLVRSGSFLRSYDADSSVPDYNVDAGRGPRSIGHVELEITFQDTQRLEGRTRRLDVRGIA